MPSPGRTNRDASPGRASNEGRHPCSKQALAQVNKGTDRLSYGGRRFFGCPCLSHSPLGGRKIVRDVHSPTNDQATAQSREVTILCPQKGASCHQTCHTSIQEVRVWSRMSSLNSWLAEDWIHIHSHRSNKLVTHMETGSSVCRISLDKMELRHKGQGLFGLFVGQSSGFLVWMCQQNIWLRLMCLKNDVCNDAGTTKKFKWVPCFFGSRIS